MKVVIKDFQSDYEDLEDENKRNETDDLGADHCNQNDNIEKPLYKLFPIIDPSTLI